MIIFNTTYCLDHSVCNSGLVWLRENYIPKALESGEVHTPRMLKILTDESEGVNYSLQFRVESIEILEVWYRSTGDLLHHEMLKLFGEKMVGFSTLLEEVGLA